MGQQHRVAFRIWRLPASSCQVGGVSAPFLSMAEHCPAEEGAEKPAPTQWALGSCGLGGRPLSLASWLP